MSRRYEHSHGFVYFVSLDVCLTTLSLAMFIKLLQCSLKSCCFIYEITMHYWLLPRGSFDVSLIWFHISGHAKVLLCMVRYSDSTCPGHPENDTGSACSGRNNHVIKLQNLLFVSALFKEPLKTKLYAWQRNSFIIQTIKYRSVGTYTINSAQSSTVMCVWSSPWYPCIEYT